MSDYVKIKKTLLTAIADAIRAKFALGGTYTPAQMAETINSVAIDGESINDNKFITGAFTEYVNEDVREIVTGAFYNSDSLTSVSFPSVTKISGHYAFGNCDALTSVDFPALTNIAGSNVFSYCTALTSISLPELTTVASYTFYYCTNLTSVDLPKLTSMGSGLFGYCQALTAISLPLTTSIGYGAFQGCTALTSVDLPLATTTGNYVFQNCTALVTLDLPALTTIGAYCAFYGCTSLTALILRSSTMCTCGTTNPFYNTPIVSGTGYIYVPSALVDTYKADSTWATYAAQIRAIEDYPDICGTST